MSAAPLPATLDRFEGEWAVLRLADGQELVWPRQQLPAEAKEGGQFLIEVRAAGEAEDNRQSQARQLLSQLLRGE